MVAAVVVELVFAATAATGVVVTVVVVAIVKKMGTFPGEAAATRWCRGPTSASRWEKRGFDSSCVGIFSS